MPKVSIIVPVYNVEQYIEDCVRSLYEQTLDDIEIILVDDCSPDKSIEIALRVLEEYPKRKNQVKVVRHEKNTGIGIVRRDGFRAAKGKYVIYVDSDDFVDADWTRLLYEKAESECADIAICDYYRYKKGREIHGTIVTNGITGEGEMVRDDIINRKVPPFLFIKLMRHELLEGDFLWPQKSMGDDTLLSTQAAFRSKKISYVAEPLCYYRDNPNSITKMLDEEHCLKNLNDFKTNVDDVIRFLEKEGVADKYSYGININKIRTKNRLLKIIGIRGYRKLWLKTYPEINKLLFLGDRTLKLTIKEHLWFWLLLLGFYPNYKKKMKKWLKPRKEMF